MKPRKTIKMTPGKINQFNKALTDLEAHYGDLANVWGQLTPEQRRAVLDNSPVLSAYVTFFRGFSNGA